jgi:class 3 adenylate cyclase/phosphoglycerate-specific signal transduction histidine kinase
MTVSADSGVDTVAGDQPPARPLGVRARLLLAFLGFAGLTVAACAVAWLVFAAIERAVNRVTQESVPGMVEALALSKTVADISASAPALFASSNQEELAAERASLEGEIDRFTKIAAALGRAGRYEEGERPIADAAVDLLTELDGLAESVERRLALKRQRESMTAELNEAHARFNEMLEPLVDDAVFDLVITGEGVMADNTASINNLVDGGVSRIDHLLSVNAAVNLAAGLMGEAINVANPVLLEPIHERFLSASLAIERSLRQLPDGPRTEAVKRASASLLALGREGLFAAGGSAGAGRTLPADTGERLKQRHEQVLLTLTPMIDDAAFDLVMTTEDLTARSEKAIAGLIDENADVLSLMLTARAEGNLVASLLSDSAVAADQNLILPLVERFTASEARLKSVLSKVAGVGSYEDLSQSTNALLDFGRGDASIFDLRSAELRQVAAGEAALDASRALSRQLGELASSIVARAETASRVASESSARAIDQGQAILALITLLGLAGAAIAMLGYVDPRIIRPVGRITSAMTQLAAGDTSVDIPGRDRKDEIGDMARALGVFRDNAIAVQEANLREIQATRQRLADAIESISEGFSIFDVDDRLVISNNREEMLYPDMPEMIIPGVTFEELLRRVVSNGLVVDALDDPEAWIAERLRQHRNPGPTHIQQRSNGRFIMVSERKTADGGTVTVYSDITELKQRESDLARKSMDLEQLAGQLAKYLSPQVYESIFTGRQEVKVASQRKKLTVFFSDIVDFTATSEKLQPEDLTLLLNEYLTEMANIALSYGATIDKYVGDAMVIFFGDPETRGVQEDALNCVEMAIAMRDKMHELQEGWRDRGIEKPVKIRIGINTGFCTVGNFGSEARMDYTIIGAGVNLAARLETASEHGGILISYETYALVKDRIHCEPQGPITVKGVSQPVATYRVVDTYERLGRKSDVVRAELLNLHLDMDAGAMSQSEREEAQAALRRALERLSSAADRDGAGKS